MEAIHVSILCLFYVFISSKYFYYKTHLDFPVNVTLAWMSEGYKVMLIYIGAIYLRNTTSLDIAELAPALFISAGMISAHVSIFIVLLFTPVKSYKEEEPIEKKESNIGDRHDFPRNTTASSSVTKPFKKPIRYMLDAREPIVVYFITGLVLSCTIIYMLKGGVQ